MRLDEFLKRPDWTEEKLAREASRHLKRRPSVTASTINRLKRGKRKQMRTASVQLALAIERATGGAVRAEEVPMTTGSRRLLAQLRPPIDNAVSDGASAA